MYKASLSHVLKALYEIPNNGNRLLFGQFFPFVDKFFQIPLVAKLRDDVAIVGRAVNIIAFQDVRVAQLLESVYLSLQHLFLGLVLKALNIDDFYSYQLLIFLI